MIQLRIKRVSVSFAPTRPRHLDPSVVSQTIFLFPQQPFSDPSYPLSLPTFYWSLLFIWLSNELAMNKNCFLYLFNPLTLLSCLKEPIGLDLKDPLFGQRSFNLFLLNQLVRGPIDFAIKMSIFEWWWLGRSNFPYFQPNPSWRF